jgi:hypothetical protein
MTAETKQYTMSDLHKVTDRVITLVPADFEQHEAIVRDLTHFRDSLYYSPPEMVPNKWQTLCDKLNYYIGDPAGRDWVEQIAVIVRGDD